MFTKEQVKYIDALWLKAKERFEGREKAFVPVLDTCTIEEGICLKYVYSFMPLSDIADYDGKLILQFVKGALKAREAFSWAKSVPVEVFLNYVLGYMVNNGFFSNTLSKSERFIHEGSCTRSELLVS